MDIFILVLFSKSFVCKESLYLKVDFCFQSFKQRIQKSIMKKSFWAKNSEIESDKTMVDELMYILINEKQNQPFYRMK